MNVLVTGSSGSIGSAIAARLRPHALVTGLDLVPGPATTRIGDIADAGLVRAMMRGVNAVVHTAALHVPHLAARGEDEFLRVNVHGTRALLEAAAEAGVSRFPSRIDRVYPIDNAVRVLGYAPRYGVGSLLGLSGPSAG